jgi:glycosyl transferase family 87
MRPDPAPWVDAGLYGLAAVLAALSARFDAIPLQADWGGTATLPYAAAAGLALAAALGWGRLSVRARRLARSGLAIAVVTGATLVPLGVEVTARAAEGRHSHAQSEAILVEEAAGALVRGENPYAVSYADGPLASWPLGTALHFAYEPGSVVLGLPSVAAGGAPGDMRVVAFVATAIVTLVGLARSGAAAHRRVWAGLLVLGLPTGARGLVGGSLDPLVLALGLLALVLLERRRPIGAGLAIGVASAVKQIAWPVVPFLVLAARDGEGRPARGRALLAAGGVAGAVILPFLAWDPAAFVEDTVRFPLGLTALKTQASDPTLGGLLRDGLGTVAGTAVIAVLLAAVMVLLFRRPPSSASDAAARAAALLLAAIVLAPAGRAGYLVYPLCLFAWSRWALRPSRSSGLDEDGDALDRVVGVPAGVPRRVEGLGAARRVRRPDAQDPLAGPGVPVEGPPPPDVG